MASSRALRRIRAPACALLGCSLAQRPERPSTAGQWRQGPRQACTALPVLQAPVRCATEKPERALYPELQPYQSGTLTTSDGKQKLYYEVSGNPAGKPALFLHGGPGDGSSSKHRRLFDPEVYRIVVFDQRGAGKSTPAGSLDGNTSEDLVNDIEQLREFLGVKQWSLVVGGSWGSTLSLLYSTRHPAKVSGLVLYSIFIPSPEAVKWPYSREGAGLFFPEQYEAFLRALPVEERADPIDAYAKRLSSSDPSVCYPARSSYTLWIMRLLGLQPDEDFIASCASQPEQAGPGSAIELHYMKHGCFVDSEQLLEDCWRIARVPCAIIHGQNDVLCTPQNAWLLRKRLPLASLLMVPMAGHSSSMAPQLRSAVIEAIDSFR